MKNFYLPLALAIATAPMFHVAMAAADYAKGHAYHLAIAHGGVPELAAHVEAQLAGLIHSARSYVRTQVSPALGVHTGPGLIGIGVQRLV